MAEIKVPDYASFKLWWEKTNEMGTAIGDLSTLDPDIDPVHGGATDPNLVSAINSLLETGTGSDRLLLARAIAMS